jgi:hypothetical protein
MARLGNDSIPYLALFILGALTRRGLIHVRAITYSRVASHTLLMGKRRTVGDSDDEQDGKQVSPSSAKRSRLDSKDQAEHRSPKSKGKGKARDDSDILNDFRVDEDDDITAIRDVHAEEDEVSQERFEEEHEESIRESIRQRNRQQGVGFLFMPSPSALKLPLIGRCKIWHY